MHLSIWQCCIRADKRDGDIICGDIRYLTTTTKTKLEYLEIKLAFQLLLRSDMEKDNFFTRARIEPKLFYPKQVRKLQKKSEFAAQQRKMYLTTTLSKIGSPHNYKSNNCIINLLNLKPQVLPQKAQNRTKTHFCNKTAQNCHRFFPNYAERKITQALLARSYVFYLCCILFNVQYTV